MRRVIVAAALLALATPVALAIPAPAPFQPSFIAGNWKGTWHNLKFGSTGPAYIKAKAIGTGKTAKLNFRSDFGGNVFGCADPAPETTTVTPGKGANHWNALGFVVKVTSKALGKLTLTYNNVKKTITGSGGNPPCNPGLTWTVTGKFVGKTFNGTVVIHLPDASTAISKIALKKS